MANISTLLSGRRGPASDSDKLDNLDSTQFLRSDQSDTMTGDLTLQSTGSVSLTLAADTDNLNEADVPTLVFSQDNGLVTTTMGGLLENDFHITGTFGTTNMIVTMPGAGFTFNGNDVWHAGNDGAGSGLDADLLDGLSGTQFLRSDASDTMTGNLTVTGSVAATSFVAFTADDRVKYGVQNDSVNYGMGFGTTYTHGHLTSSAVTFQVFASAGRGFWWGDTTDTNAQGAMSLTHDGKLHVDDIITVGPNKLPVGPNLPKSRNFTVGGNLLVTDVGQHVNITAAATPVIPDATFAEGDIITLVNTSGADRTITCSITTAYVGGADVATCTLASFGLCTILFTSATQCFIAGDVS